MKRINKKTSMILLVLITVAALSASPVFARMGGGSGGGSGSGGGGSVGRGGSMNGSSSSNRSDRPARRMMDSDDRHFNVDSMPGITTGGVGSGDMTMDIRPLRYKDGRLEFKYKANTHSVSLGDYDLMELATLEANGKVYRPVQADPMRGHHAGGRIAFEVPERPDQFRIVIREIPQVVERSYDWN